MKYTAQCLSQSKTDTTARRYCYCCNCCYFYCRWLRVLQTHDLWAGYVLRAYSQTKDTYLFVDGKMCQSFCNSMEREKIISVCKRFLRAIFFFLSKHFKRNCSKILFPVLFSLLLLFLYFYFFFVFFFFFLHWPMTVLNDKNITKCSCWSSIFQT